MHPNSHGYVEPKNEAEAYERIDMIEGWLREDRAKLAELRNPEHGVEIGTMADKESLERAIEENQTTIERIDEWLAERSPSHSSNPHFAGNALPGQLRPPGFGKNQVQWLGLTRTSREEMKKEYREAHPVYRHLSHLRDFIVNVWTRIGRAISKMDQGITTFFQNILQPFNE